MTSVSPIRAALTPLPVNRFGTPTSTRLGGPQPLSSRKRPIDDVEGVENQRDLEKAFSKPLDPSRLGVSPWKQSKSENAFRTTKASVNTRDEASFPSPVLRTRELEDSQISNQTSSNSSVMEYDPDDTMNTQQTAATEATEASEASQPSISRHLDTLRIRLRLAQYKIQTNQTNIPFSRLRLSTASVSPQSQLEMTAESSKGPDGSDEQPRVPSRRLLSPFGKESRQDRTFNSSQIEETKTKTQPHEHDDDDNEEEQDPKPNAQVSFQTPKLPRHRPGSFDQSTTTTAMTSQSTFPKDDLTSSAVRGKVAMSLIGLRES